MKMRISLLPVSYFVQLTLGISKCSVKLSRWRLNSSTRCLWVLEALSRIRFFCCSSFICSNFSWAFVLMTACFWGGWLLPSPLLPESLLECESSWAFSLFLFFLLFLQVENVSVLSIVHVLITSIFDLLFYFLIGSAFEFKGSTSYSFVLHFCFCCENWKGVYSNSPKKLRMSKLVCYSLQCYKLSG